MLVEVRSPDYSLDHEVIIYFTATLPIQQARIERVALGDLPHAAIEIANTVVIPPVQPLQTNPEIHARLKALDLSMGEGVRCEWKISR